MKVFKFGGASVKDADGVRNLASIVSTYNDQLVIVVSAMGKMTNALEELVRFYFQKDERKWEQLNMIKRYHQLIVSELFEPSDEIFAELDMLFFKIEDRLHRKPSIDYDFEYDQLVYFGELLSTHIVSAYLNKTGYDNKWIDIRFSLKTTSEWRRANIDWDLSGQLIGETFNFQSERCYLTQGFIGATPSDLTTTLGREGSDYTAAILAAVLHAEAVVVWKDVPGIMNADPKLFPNSVKIDFMTYREAVELTFFGAQIIHPKTIKPLFSNNIPLYVRSFLQPDAHGTIIGPEKEGSTSTQLPIYIVKPKQVLITLSQPDFSFMDEESVSWLFETFGELGLRVNLFQHSALNLTISIDSPDHGVVDVIETLSEEFEVRYNDGLELLTIRNYTPDSVTKSLVGKRVYVEQRSRKIARFLVKNE
jgi:aspartate kinase